MHMEHTWQIWLSLHSPPFFSKEWNVETCSILSGAQSLWKLSCNFIGPIFKIYWASPGWKYLLLMASSLSLFYWTKHDPEANFEAGNHLKWCSTLRGRNEGSLLGRTWEEQSRLEKRWPFCAGCHSPILGVLCHSPCHKTLFQILNFKRSMCLLSYLQAEPWPVTGCSACHVGEGEKELILKGHPQ